jgi:hypothetical protein
MVLLTSVGEVMTNLKTPDTPDTTTRRLADGSSLILFGEMRQGGAAVH